MKALEPLSRSVASSPPCCARGSSEPEPCSVSLVAYQLMVVMRCRKRLRSSSPRTWSSSVPVVDRQEMPMFRRPPGRSPRRYRRVPAGQSDRPRPPHIVPRPAARRAQHVDWVMLLLVPRRVGRESASRTGARPPDGQLSSLRLKSSPRGSLFDGGYNSRAPSAVSCPAPS